MAIKGLKIGIIGTGKRATYAYAKYLKEFDPKVCRLALSDPHKNTLEDCIKEAPLDFCPVSQYEDWQELLDKEKELDGVIITTPNYMHYTPAIRCIEQDIPVALEKPLATNEHDCTELLQKSKQNGVPVLLGFVLRSSPFYQTVKSIIDSGKIGRIISIQSDELVSFTVSSAMFRGAWRRFYKMSGGTLLEKSCHDMDLLNWLTGSKPTSLNSYGGQHIYKQDSSLPKKCSACPQREDCVYKKEENNKIDGYDQHMAEYLREIDDCIYNLDSDCYDIQSVQIEYENGVVCNFLMNYHTTGERSGRNIHIIGTKGRIWGSNHEGCVYSCENSTGKTEKHEYTSDGSGHGGADRKHIMEFLKIIKDHSYQPVASVRDGYLSAMMCFAADHSIREGRRVLFKYPSDNHIEIT